MKQLLVGIALILTGCAGTVEMEDPLSPNQIITRHEMLINQLQTRNSEIQLRALR